MGRGAHHCLQRCSPQALLNSRDFHLEYSTSQDNISSSKLKLPRHLLPAAHYHCSPWASSNFTQRQADSAQQNYRKTTSGKKKVNVLLPVEWNRYSPCGQSSSLGVRGWSREGGTVRPSPLGVSKQLRQLSPAATTHLEAAAHAAELEIIPQTLSRWFPLKCYLKYLYLSPSYQMTFLTL